jgi:hypothetical protein
MFRQVPLVAAVVSLSFVSPALAQNFSFDARRIGLGSPGGGQNLGSKMIEEENKYRVIPLPFGLIQVFQDIDRLNPSKDEFDIVRASELIASPLHYTFGRDRSDSAADDFIVDITNGDLNRDLNAYKGFIPVNQPAAEGLYAGNWGKTIKLVRGPGNAFQGLYVGAGPYVSMRTEPTIDDRLTSILRPGDPVYFTNAQLTARDATQFQAALAITGGYRGRVELPGREGSDREGVYIALNYNYLKGFRYEDIDARVRMDTDSRGLLTVNPFLPVPLFVARTNSESGTGMAVDLGVGVVVSNWEFGVGANGVGNRLNWSEVERTIYSQSSLVTGNDDLDEGVPVPVADVRVELPVDVKANIGYDVDRWAVVAEVGHGFNGKSFHGGAEYRFGAIDVRGGGVYSRELWNPSAGVGLNMSQRVSLDVAVYSNSANVERKRNPAVAVSIRLNR